MTPKEIESIKNIIHLTAQRLFPNDDQIDERLMYLTEFFERLEEIERLIENTQDY